MLEGLQGTFTSPGYPNSYANSLSCEWTISVPTGQVRISFSDFDIESHSSCNYDSVTVSRKPSLVYQTQKVAAGVLGLVSHIGVIPGCERHTAYFWVWYARLEENHKSFSVFSIIFC